MSLMWAWASGWCAFVAVDAFVHGAPGPGLAMVVMAVVTMLYAMKLHALLVAYLAKQAKEGES